MLFLLSNIYAFAQASVILTIEKFESTPFKKVIKSRVKYDQDRVNKRLTSDSISRELQMSSYIWLTARIRFCVINLRRNKRSR